MIIQFIFTETPDIERVAVADRFISRLEVVDAFALLPNAAQQVRDIAVLMGEFTQVCLFVHCPQLELDYEPFKIVERTNSMMQNLHFNIHTLMLRFKGERAGWKTSLEQSLHVFAPIDTDLPSPPKEYPRVHAPGLKIKQKKRKHPPYHKISHLLESRTSMLEEAQQYILKVQQLCDVIAQVLNADPQVERWSFAGFHPRYVGKTLVTRNKNYQRKERETQRKEERIEERRKAREAKIAAQPQVTDKPLEHGAGRTVGARPGKYKDVQMRSQLEIRFAAQLDERSIRWVYEAEILGEAGYLVDFYLPDLGVWVEVKGRFEARDRQVLPEVAKVLKQERQQRLLVFTNSGKCVVVNPSGFREIERTQFWAEVMR